MQWSGRFGRLRKLEMDEAALEGGDDRLSSVIHVEAHENHADVTFHRGLSDAEIAGAADAFQAESVDEGCRCASEKCRFSVVS